MIGCTNKAWQCPTDLLWRCCTLSQGPDAVSLWQSAHPYSECLSEGAPLALMRGQPRCPLIQILIMHLLFPSASTSSRGLERANLVGFILSTVILSLMLEVLRNEFVGS